MMMLMGSLVIAGYAQDDDVYFVPSKKKQNTQPAEEYVPNESTYTPITPYDTPNDYDNWADGRENGDRDVDEYNRRYRNDNLDNDSTATDSNWTEPEDYANGDCTARLVRFHAPHAGYVVSSPYYADVVDVWLDPWFYDPWYSPWGWYSWNYGWYGWNYGWGYGWHYGWGWSPYWGSYWGPGWAWCDPWHHHHHGWGPGWWEPGHGHHPNYYAGNIGPRGGYVGRYDRNNTHIAGTTGSNRGYRPGTSGVGGSRGNTYRPSRNYGNSDYRPSRTTGNSNTSRSGRSFGNTNSSRSDRTLNTTGNGSRTTGNSSRTMGNSSRTTGNSSRVSSTPSRSGGSFSTGGHSSGRSFGGGGGSRGGRR